jgi:hypothetical protein
MQAGKKIYSYEEFVKKVLAGRESMDPSASGNSYETETMAEDVFDEADLEAARIDVE